MGAKTAIQWSDATWHEKSAAGRIGVTVEELLARRALHQKWCTKCKGWHHISFFTIDRSRWDGRNTKCSSNTRRPKSKEEKRAQANATYRRYNAGAGHAGISAQKMARKRGCEPISPRDRELVMDTFDGLCAYCGEPATTIDHIVPVSKGGHSRRGNLLAACNSCNSRKRARDFEEFLATAKNPSPHISDELLMEYVL